MGSAVDRNHICLSYYCFRSIPFIIGNLTTHHDVIAFVQQQALSCVFFVFKIVGTIDIERIVCPLPAIAEGFLVGQVERCIAILGTELLDKPEYLAPDVVILRRLNASSKRTSVSFCFGRSEWIGGSDL